MRKDDSYPRRPDPIISLPPKPAGAAIPTDEKIIAAEAERDQAVKLARVVYDWVGGAEGAGDGDTWEGFYLSLDLISPDPELEALSVE